VAGNLGAGVIQAAAAELEKAIAGREKPERTTALCQQLNEAMTALVGLLLPALGAGPPAAAAAVDPAQWQAVAAQMKKYLEEFDPAAAECLESHRELFRAAFGEGNFSVFEQQIQNYAFDAAAAQLAQARGL
jgi:hypothetical protein